MLRGFYIGWAVILIPNFHILYIVVLMRASLLFSKDFASSCGLVTFKADTSKECEQSLIPQEHQVFSSNFAPEQKGKLGQKTSSAAQN